jgi:hypothetical protein
VHAAHACAGPWEGSDHFGSYVRGLSLHFCKRLFLDFEPWPAEIQFRIVNDRITEHK